MKPDWDDLGEKYENSKKILIGAVDCTAESSKPLCDRFEIQGFPTIKYFNPPDRAGKNYEEGRSFKELRSFVKKKLKPQCSLKYFSRCSPEQKEELTKYAEMSTEDRHRLLMDMQEELSLAEAKHLALMRRTQEEQRQSKEEWNEIQKKLNDPIEKIRLVEA